MSDPVIVFYSDFNCPFCFALNERILAMGESAKVDWRGIEHMPAADTAKSTLVDQTQLINEVAVVRKRAPEVTIVTPDFRPSTRLANRLLLALKDVGRLKRAEVRTRIYRAYWQRGEDISCPEVLAQICQLVGVDYPATGLDDAGAIASLAEWQREWESEQFHCRLPAMVSVAANKPVLGFPTYDLLSNFFSGEEIGLAPESLAACELKPRQVILLVGAQMTERCNTTELEAAYQVVSQPNPAAAQQWLDQQDCLPDMLVIDAQQDLSAALGFCCELRALPAFRFTALILLGSVDDQEVELAAFDAGATDVLFDLTNPKVCQARLDLHLRMKRSATLLASLARMDYLTELPNRRECDRKLEQEWLRLRRKKASLALVLIDIDHFKAYNDHYGHSLGDDCLRQVAKAMSRCLRRPADMLARYGGEEFMAILPETDCDGAEVVAAAMVRAVSDMALPHEASSTADVVTISAGVAALVPEGASTPREISELADAALYRAKSSGRNRVCR